MLPQSVNKPQMWRLHSGLTFSNISTDRYNLQFNEVNICSSFFIKKQPICKSRVNFSKLSQYRIMSLIQTQNI